MTQENEFYKDSVRKRRAWSLIAKFLDVDDIGVKDKLISGARGINRRHN